MRTKTQYGVKAALLRQTSHFAYFYGFLAIGNRYKSLNLHPVIKTEKMKVLYMIFAAGMLLTSCTQESKEISTNDISNSQTADGSAKGSLPDMKFEEETHDFGRITQGEKVAFAFKFRNTGSSNLIISAANGSCGCTIPEYPKKPIAPGEEAAIDVVFNSEGKSGIAEKSVTLVTNCEPSTKIIYIKANIIVPTSTNSNESPTFTH